MNGGTLPTSITQNVTFYNTTGIIEKHKNIYFCPKIKNDSVVPTTVSDLYFAKFNLKCLSKTNDDYKNINISQWSPEDRTLRIKGNIDDFRTETNYGNAYNYCIVKRKVDNRTYWYAFFVNSATQVGGGSIELSLEPDHFTNVFYLFNHTRCDYNVDMSDVFNGKLKNCYVARQHYDRVELDEEDITKCKETNLDIFSQIEESFKYKRQFRDYKQFLNYGDMFTREEEEDINETEWEELDSELKIKCIKASCAFIHLTLNSNVIALHYQSELTQPNGYYNSMPHLHLSDNLIRLVMPVYHELDLLSKYRNNIEPLFESLLFFGKNSLTNIEGNCVNLYYNHSIINMFLKSSSVLTEYVVNAFITKESCLLNYMEFTDSSITLKINLKAPTASDSYIEEKGYLNFCIFPKIGEKTIETQRNIVTSVTNGTTYYNYTRSQVDNKIYFRYTSDVITSTSDYCIFCIEKIEDLKFDLDLSSKSMNKNNIKENYYDTVLTFNPYSFYSISYLGVIETPLNKIHYYENPIIECSLNVVTGETMKYSFVPTYNINGLKYKMYSESIEQTLTNNLTVITSKLTDYIIANNAQMKSQYAVNDYQRTTDLITGAIGLIGNSAKGAVSGAMIGGPSGAGIGAITGTIAGTTDLINSAISKDRNVGLIEMNQKAKLADLGTLPSNLKQVGSDIKVDLIHNELGLYLNHYTIDEVSYNSICKYLERFGYLVNIYDTLHIYDRVGWNYVQLISFDYEAEISMEQEDSIRQIFKEGVTLLHNEEYYSSGHNYETILE